MHIFILSKGLIHLKELLIIVCKAVSLLIENMQLCNFVQWLANLRDMLLAEII